MLRWYLLRRCTTSLRINWKSGVACCWRRAILLEIAKAEYERTSTVAGLYSCTDHTRSAKLEEYSKFNKGVNGMRRRKIDEGLGKTTKAQIEEEGYRFSRKVTQNELRCTTSADARRSSLR